MLCMVTVTLFRKHSDIKSRNYFIFIWPQLPYRQGIFQKKFRLVKPGDLYYKIRFCIVIIFHFLAHCVKRPARDLKPWIYVPVEWNSKHSWIQALQKYRLTSTIAKLYIHQFNSIVIRKKGFIKKNSFRKKIDNHLSSGQSKL